MPTSRSRETATLADSVEDAVPTFDPRLAVLSRVQELLSRSQAEELSIGRLLRLALDALGAGTSTGRISLAGPEAAPPPGSVQTLALALHELATDARKPTLASKRLQVRRARGAGGRWTCIGPWPGPDGPRLLLKWYEEGAPREANTGMGGDGRQLIEKALPRVLGPETRYEVTEKGVNCMIALPLAAPSALPAVTPPRP